MGAGPGDPGLITVKGRECIRRADVIIYDRLANPRLLSEGQPEADKIYVGKRGSNHTVEQNQISELLVAQARQGKTVARLKGGDAFIFGRGGEEAVYLADQGIPFEIIPGVSSAYAVPAYAGIPVTHRGLAGNVAFITGHEQSRNAGAAKLVPDRDRGAETQAERAEGIVPAEAVKSVGTLVFLMGVKNLPRIVEELSALGKSPDTPTAVIRWGTTADQQTLTGRLDEIVSKVRRQDFHPPAVIVVGEVVKLREKLAWFENKPLFGKRAVVTRATDQAGILSRLLQEAGAEVIEFPTIKIQCVSDSFIIEQSIEEMASGRNKPAFDWAIFTSTNAVRFFYEFVRARQHDSRLLSGIKIAAIGESTAISLEKIGLMSDVPTRQFSAEGLIEQFARPGTAGQRILIPRAKKARETLPEALREMGAEVVVAPVYENVLADTPTEPLKKELNKGKIDFITFTSGSTAKNFGKLLAPNNSLSELIGRTKIAAIGPVTAEVAAKLGLAVDIMPDKASIPELVKAMIRRR